MAILINAGVIRVTPAGVSRRRSLFILILCVLLAALVFTVYLATSVSIGGGQPIMPLDDAYIHFQYARQIAAGQPYVYNPGLPPTSGATSFLYPYLLAVGDLIGLRGLNLGAWAMLLGAVGLALSGWLVYRVVAFAAPFGIALALAVAFLLDGWVGWHFMSGMETGVVILLTLATLYAVLAVRLRLLVGVATLLALVRPEGGLLAVIACGVMFVQLLLAVPFKRGDGIFGRLGVPRLWLWQREWLLLLIPALALGVQPLVNLLVTGSAVASGNAAKSLLGIVPFEFDVVIGRILDNFISMWREFLTDYLYVSGMAVVGFGVMLRARRWRLVAVMIALWLLAGTAAIATLDTAFWHFKRYQMSLIALFFPLAGWGWGFVYRLARYRLRRGVANRALLVAALLAVALVIAVAVSTLLRGTAQFVANYALNVGYVVAQPLEMARWLAANTPEDARIAVHDVGMMQYVGGRTTVDIVGLTTAGAAAYWRNGPGAVGEFIDRQRPDLIASYGEGHGLGLGYLQNTDLYAETLARYTVSLDPVNNVALAAPTQGIYAPDWTAAERAESVVMLPRIAPYLDGLALTDTLNVADVESEAAHAYEWHNQRAAGGFPSEYYQFGYVGCAVDCTVMEGGRRINGAESFTLATQPRTDAVLVTRLHAGDAATFDVYADDQLVSTRVIPALAGSWLEVPTLIPAALVTREQTRIRIVPHSDGDYQPYRHWLYVGAYHPQGEIGEPLVTFQDGAIRLSVPALALDDDTLRLSLDWAINGAAHGDYKVFIHVLNSDGDTVAQADDRPGAGNLPPGNWLPGGFRDTINLTMLDVPAGAYRVVMGLYDPVTFERLEPTASQVDADRRVTLGEIEVK